MVHASAVSAVVSSLKRKTETERIERNISLRDSRIQRFKIIPPVFCLMTIRVLELIPSNKWIRNG